MDQTRIRKIYEKALKSNEQHYVWKEGGARQKWLSPGAFPEQEGYLYSPSSDASDHCISNTAVRNLSN